VRLEQARGPTAALRIGKTWEVVSWENTLGKLLYGKSTKHRILRGDMEYISKWYCKPLIFTYPNPAMLPC